MKYTHIVWDFNGTLLDDVEVGILAVNRMLQKRGIPTVADAQEYRRVFCFPIQEYYRAIGFDFSVEPYEVLAPEWVANYREFEHTARVYPQAEAWLSRFAQSGVKQVLLSATERSMLIEQVKALRLDGYFCRIYGLDNIHAHSKKSLAEAFRCEHPDAVPLLIGDTLHDAEAAEAMGADCVLFCGGHQSRERLARTGLPVISDFSELAQFLT